MLVITSGLSATLPRLTVVLYPCVLTGRTHSPEAALSELMNTSSVQPILSPLWIRSGMDWSYGVVVSIF